MTDVVLNPTAKLLRSRPPLELTRPMDWLAYSAINALLRRTRLADGSYPTWVMSLPDSLTKSRVQMFPVAALFAWAAVWHKPVAAMVCFTMIAMLMSTDGLDGSLARAIPAESKWGSKWDPIMDKVAGASLMFWWLVLVHHFARAQFVALLWLVAVRVALDVVLALIALAEDRRGQHPKAGPSGKIKAFADDLAMIAGYGGMIAFAFGASERSLTLTAEALLLVACLFAPVSIYQHTRNLLRGRRT